MAFQPVLLGKERAKAGEPAVTFHMSARSGYFVTGHGMNSNGQRHE